VNTSTDVQRPAPGRNGPAGKAAPRNVQYPIGPRINIDPLMAAALQRISRRQSIPEGILCRSVLRAYFAQQDPRYRQEVEADCA